MMAMEDMGIKYLLKTITLVLFLAIVACESEATPEAYISFQRPANFPAPTYDFSENPFTQEKFALGKRLFYEGNLSSDGTISCGFCHEQSFAFTHHGHDLSDGVGGALGTRNTQPIQNMAYMEDFTWDGAVRHLDLQPIIPIEAEVEMNETIANVLEKLRADQSYVTDFQNSFVLKAGESNIINIRTLTQALAQFMNALVSANSRYDRYVRNESMEPIYSQDEKAGLEVFKEKCSSCHAGELFTDQSYRNNGLLENPRFPEELGRSRVNDEDNGKNAVDYYKFKVPSLRNVWVTYPYMHDGRLRDINAVLEHYNKGVQDAPNLDPLLNNNGVLGIPLNTEEKRVLKEFLKSLTDEKFITDERFAEN